MPRAPCAILTASLIAAPAPANAAPASTSPSETSSCPDEAQAAKSAERGFNLRRSGALAEAADAFAAAYRCMPRDRQHEARWEHLVAYVETAQKLSTAVPSLRREYLCSSRSLIEDYRASVAALSPAPESATYATEEAKRTEQEIIDRLGSVEVCDTSHGMLLDTTARDGRPARPPAAKPTATTPPETAPDPPAPVEASQAEPRPSPPKRRRAPSPGRPLTIAGITTGALSLAPLLVMSIGLSNGNKAEDASAEASAAGDLNKIRDDLHSDGVIANRMAYAGAIVGGALLVTTVALLVAAKRRDHRPPTTSRLAPTGAGLLLRF